MFFSLKPCLVDGLHLLERLGLHTPVLVLHLPHPDQVDVGGFQLLRDQIIKFQGIPENTDSCLELLEVRLCPEVKYQAGVGGDCGLHELDSVHLLV